MKKTIYFLCSLACINVAFAQQVTLIQGNGAADASSVGNKATLTQEGGVTVSNVQFGMSGQATISQTALVTNDNNLNVTQFGNDNRATVNQTGQTNKVDLIQTNGASALLGGNVAEITQSGMNNTVLALQTTGLTPASPVYGNQLKVSQTADNGLIEVFQTGTVGGNNAFLTQSSDNSIIRVVENGAYNTASITQKGGSFNSIYLELDNSASLTSIGNNASINQTGSGNIFQVRFIGDNNQITVDQLGNNNLLTDAYASYGIGSLTGSNNTVKAIQHGDNLSGWINIAANNYTLNVVSVAY